LEKKFETSQENLNRATMNIEILNDTIIAMNERLVSMQEKFDLFTGSNLRIGFSLGFNLPSRSDEIYEVGPDSTIKALPSYSGSIVASSMISYHLPETDFEILANINVAEIGIGSGGDLSTVFNQELTAGIGAGYRLDKDASFFVVLNFTRVPIISEARRLSTKLDLPIGSSVEPNQYKTRERGRLSLYFGILLKLGKGIPEEDNITEG
jgi:hypothetical protein